MKIKCIHRISYNKIVMIILKLCPSLSILGTFIFEGALRALQWSKKLLKLNNVWNGGNYYCLFKTSIMTYLQLYQIISQTASTYNWGMFNFQSCSEINLVNIHLNILFQIVMKNFLLQNIKQLQMNDSITDIIFESDIRSFII